MPPNGQKWNKKRWGKNKEGLDQVLKMRKFCGERWHPSIFAGGHTSEPKTIFAVSEFLQQIAAAPPNGRLFLMDFIRLDLPAVKMIIFRFLSIIINGHHHCGKDVMSRAHFCEKKGHSYFFRWPVCHWVAQSARARNMFKYFISQSENESEGCEKWPLLTAQRNLELCKTFV